MKSETAWKVAVALRWATGGLMLAAAGAFTVGAWGGLMTLISPARAFILMIFGVLGGWGAAHWAYALDEKEAQRDRRQ